MLGASKPFGVLVFERVVMLLN